jgi:pseudouridine synthase
VTERLQKFLARAGVASRRAAETLILEGRVTVNGDVVDRLGSRVGPGDAVKVDGRRILAPTGPATVLVLNKPRACVTTMSDPEGRPTVRDLIPRGLRTRVYPVGRLDYHTEGLLLLTDDGDLARDLLDPGKGVPKTYVAKVRGRPSTETLRRLERGIRLEGRRTRPARAKVVKSAGNSWVEVRVVEGRKHLVRKMLRAVGHPVLRLRRVGFGGVVLGDLPPGECRKLRPAEVEILRRSAGEGGGRGKGAGRSPRRS